MEVTWMDRTKSFLPPSRLKKHGVFSLNEPGIKSLVLIGYFSEQIAITSLFHPITI
jgi:hypothetical protein